MAPVKGQLKRDIWCFDLKEPLTIFKSFSGIKTAL